MRFLFFYLLTSSAFLHSYAQNKNLNEFNFSKFHKKQFSIRASGKADFAMTTSDHIQIIDWRSDTTSIGFRTNDYFTIPDIRTAFKNQLLSLIDFNKDSNLKASNVVVCLQKIWITHHLTKVNNNWQAGIIWKVDCFKKVGDTFNYLCRLDTTIENTNTRFSPYDLVPLCLQLSAEKIESALHRRDQSDQYADINQFKNHFNDIPILQDVQKKKGLYLTYQQFLNNTPSAVDFKIEKEKFTDGLFVINSSGTYELIRNVWGYCDGQNMYIKSGEKYFQLCRVNNTFYFYGAKTIKKSVQNDLGTASLLNLATNSDRKITKYYITYYPFQLDITDGNFY
jgi:hypothetical protein